jgi:DNA processing protein
MCETDALLILNAIPGLTNLRIRQLIQCFGSAAKVLSFKNSHQFDPAGFSSEVIRNILEFSQDKFLESEYNLVTQNGVKIVTYQDSLYPKDLRGITDAPIVLYVLGNASFEDFFGIAVVGSRRASLYGLNVAEDFSRRLAEFGLTIVSGMARGIDTAAHRGALKAHGKTVAVLGSGLANIYPPENMNLCQQIEKSGAVISEFSMQTLPFPYNFPRRNRIISGLSQGVLVIEAMERSGELITADMALEQGKEVFAVPGNILNPSSRGVNNLIKQGAKLVNSLDDVLEELECPLKEFISKQKLSSSQETLSLDLDESLTSQEKKLCCLLKDQPIHLESLASLAKVSVSEISSVLFQLELKGRVRQLPGKLFLK